MATDVHARIDDGRIVGGCDAAIMIGHRLDQDGKILVTAARSAKLFRISEAHPTGVSERLIGFERKLTRFIELLDFLPRHNPLKKIKNVLADHYLFFGQAKKICRFHFYFPAWLAALAAAVMTIVLWMPLWTTTPS